MSKDLSETTKGELESILDAHGLNAVLEALSTICDEKAYHIRASYETGETAQTKAWRSAAGVMGCISCDRHVVAVSR